MIDYSGIPFLQMIPFHMFFSVQLLVAELLFLFRMRKSGFSLPRIGLCVLGYLLLCWFHPLLGHRYIRILAIFFESLLMLRLAVPVPANTVIYIGVGAYAIQNLANQCGKLVNGYLALSDGTLLYLAVAAAVYFAVYLLCYWFFIRRFPVDGTIYVSSKGCYALVILTLVIVYLRSIFISEAMENAVFGEREFMIISIVMVLYLQFSTLRWSDTEEQKRIIENLLEQEKKRHEISQKNVEIINMKCHDLRYHIKEYRKENDLEEHSRFFSEVEEAVGIYDRIARTGNAALDTVLSEKLLFTEENGISFSYMVDDEALCGIETSDLYSLFGNALDNAIQSVLSEQEDDRIISMNVRKRSGFAQIVIENFCSHPPLLRDGLPETNGDRTIHGFGTRSIRYIVEKYHGSMVIDTENSAYTLSILIPLAEEG